MSENLRDTIREHAERIAGDMLPADRPTPHVAHENRDRDARTIVRDAWPTDRLTAGDTDAGPFMLATVDRAGVMLYGVRLPDGRIVWSVYSAQATRWHDRGAVDRVAEMIAHRLRERSQRYVADGATVQGAATGHMAEHMRIVV